MKKFSRSGILKLKKIIFTAVRFLFFLKDVDIGKVLVSNKKKNFKYFIGSLYNDEKVKPLNILSPKTSTYVKGYGGQTKWK